MSKDLTKRYVDEMLEVSGVTKKGADRIQQLSKMSDTKIRSVIDDILKRAERHYEKNFHSILESLKYVKGQSRVYYFGRFTPVSTSAETSDWFIRKSALYYDRIILNDPIMPFTSLMWDMKPIIYRTAFIEAIKSLSILRPWVAEEIIELLSFSLPRLGGFGQKTAQIVEEDFKDRQWHMQALKDEDLHLEGETYLRHEMRFVRESSSSLYIRDMGGLRKAALATATRGSSLIMGNAFFGSLLTGSSPATDLARDWRLFGYWMMRRAEHLVGREFNRDQWESLVRDVKAGRAWFALDALELGVLPRLTPEKIADIRNSDDYSIKYFREDLGDAMSEIEGLRLGDETAYREAAIQVWKKVRDDARKVRRDMDTIRQKIELGVDVLFASLLLGVLPFGTAKLASTLIGTPTVLSIAEKYLDLRRQKGSTGYFLVKLEDSHRQRTCCGV